MFIFELFEARPALKTVVILPGGFHPFHPGHLSLYQSAEKMFPGADIYYAATNDKSQRPFDIKDKAALAQIAGVPPGHFVQVTSPFQAREIVSKYDPNTTAVVFARSEKDRNEPPRAGGTKKDGSSSYLQLWDGKPKPLNQHGYMAYLPTVQFSAGPSGVTSATQIRNMWPNANAKQKADIVKDLYPGNPRAATKILDKYLHEDAVAYMGAGAGSNETASPVGGVAEHIGKVKGGYRLYSHKGKNLGTFPSKSGAEKHEREVQYFKHKG
jgi:glycerol-3-phosphate cytidylyltransferase-like family protein